MTTFAEMRSLVLGITKRPELVGLTDTAIRIATQRAHQVDFFRRDLQVTQIPYTVSLTAMFYDFPNVSTSLPRLRTIKNVYGLTSEGFKIEQLEYRETDDLYDSDGAPRRYVYCVIGDTLRCFFDLPTGIAEVYYFRMPNVSVDSYSSWIADAHPDELAQWASAIVFARSGFMEIASQINETDVRPFKETLVSNYLLGGVT